MEADILYAHNPIALRQGRMIDEKFDFVTSTRLLCKQDGTLGGGVPFIDSTGST